MYFAVYLIKYNLVLAFSRKRADGDREALFLVIPDILNRESPLSIPQFLVVISLGNCSDGYLP